MKSIPRARHSDLLFKSLLPRLNSPATTVSFGTDCRDSISSLTTSDASHLTAQHSPLYISSPHTSNEYPSVNHDDSFDVYSSPLSSRNTSDSIFPPEHPVHKAPIWFQSHHIEKPLNILQWNIRGLQDKSSELWHTIQQHNLDVVMLQEVRTRYTNSGSIPIAGFDYHSDPFQKTGIYIKSSLRYHHIPINLRINVDNPEDTLYASAIVVRTHIGPTTKHILLMNIYRSPSGKQQLLVSLRDYIRQCTNYCSNLTKPIQIEGKVIGGDFNATNPLWGAPASVSRTADYGANLIDFAHTDSYGILNDGSPTRYHLNTTTKIHKHSWIDVTLASYNLQDYCTWKVNQTDHQSDHYQIFIQLSNYISSHQTPPESQPEERWSITDDEAHWSAYNDALAAQWEESQTDFNHLSTQQLDTSVSTKLSHLIRDIFCKSAATVFMKKEKQTHWKRWVSTKAQAISIAYHRQYRRFMRKRHRTSNDWNKLKAMRRNRDKVMRQHKREWIQKRFNRYTLNSKEGWQVAAEVRDLNESRGRILPDIHKQLPNGDVGDIVAKTTRDKVEYLNTHYHRFDDLHCTNNPSWCWIQSNIISNTGNYPPNDFRSAHPATEPVPIHHKHHWMPRQHRDDNYLVPNPETLHNGFADRIMQNTRKRWKNARKEHPWQLTMINSPITKMEIRRALSSFTNGKAAGPDGIEIIFLKKGGPTVVNILHSVYDLFFRKWRHIPSLFKQRWIVPVIKAGKSGKIAKELRPVSLTSYVAKIWEKIMVYRLVTYLVRLRLLSRVHFAYLSSRSPTDAVVYLVDRFTRNFNNNQETHAIFFDMTSAFDTVRIPLLLWKLEHEFFITGIFLDCLRDFLHDRSGAVKINGILSAWKADIIGVPQGGGLSPIIFIMYVDQLELADGIQGLRMSIFSDDLCISTYKCKGVTPIQALQEGLLYVQWYCYLHGLQLNLSKSYYKIFSRRQSATPSLNIQFSGRLHDFLHQNCTSTVQYETEDTNLTECREKAVRYLGIWLDTKLDFVEHANKVISRVNAVYHTIARNLHTIWNIQAAIAWHIIDSCIFSIFDFSAVFWSRFTRPSKTRWEVTYNRIMRRVFNATTGTPSIHIQHHCYAMPLERRLSSLCSQYFCRMLRAPRSSALHTEIRQYWWQIISKWSAERSPPLTDLIGDHYPHKSHDGRILIPDQASETLIWQILDNACSHNNDDFLHCIHLHHPDEIPSEISHAMDLTHEWHNHHYDETSFTDDWSIHRNQDTENGALYLFTDGSCKGRKGGFGIHGIFEKDYQSICRKSRQTRTPYKELLQDIELPFRGFLTGVSHRCSIDFMEALAVRRALEMTLEFFRFSAVEHSTWGNTPQTSKTALNVRGKLKLNEIRIIGDSQVVLKWIAGIYRIHNPHMLNIIEDIHWLTKVIQDENDNIPIYFQWTKSHNVKEGLNVTQGNAFVDVLAGKGCDDVWKDGHQTRFTDYWSWYNLRASSHYSLRFYKSLQKEDLVWSALDTNYGEIVQRKYWRDYQEEIPGFQRAKPGIEWNKYHYKELSLFSRNEMRLLLGMRTGHNNLRHWISHINPTVDGQCKCGHHRHHLIGIMEQCMLPEVQKELRTLKATAASLIRRDSIKQQQESGIPDLETFSEDMSIPEPDESPRQRNPSGNRSLFRFNDPVEYLYPRNHSPETNVDLKKAIISFYRKILRIT